MLVSACRQRASPLTLPSVDLPSRDTAAPDNQGTYLRPPNEAMGADGLWIYASRVSAKGYMKVRNRRRFMHLAAGVFAQPALSCFAWAQTYPTRPVHLIVGYEPGGSSDLFARLIGQWLSERLGQRFIIENRPGAGGNLATEMVVRAPPDGYTLLMMTTGNVWSTSLFGKQNFNLIRDIAPIATINRGIGVMEVSLSFPAKTVREFITYARANPGKINMVSGGNGSAQHFYGEYFGMLAGISMVHVPYRGQPSAQRALLAGEVHVMFDTLSTSVEQIRAGKLRALGVTSSMRSQALPDIPTLAEFVPGYEASVWQGIGAPTNTPAEVVDKLNNEVNACLADSKIKARIADFGYSVFVSSPAEFVQFIADEDQKWTKVIRAANIKAE
jgi:tripartite-type tricarboxylate transporter receptor subunit TctC